MNANLNLPAPISAMAFLGTAALLLLCVVFAVGFAILRRRKALKTALATGGVLVVSYAAMLMLFSVASLRVVVPRGQEKYFCEFDWHIAYSVVGTRFEPTQDGAGRYVVELQTRFDPTTIGPNRGDGPLRPGDRDVQLIDDLGHEYRAYVAKGPALTTPLRPGENCRTTLVFDCLRLPSMRCCGCIRRHRRPRTS
jgi:hypothetical protein